MNIAKRHRLIVQIPLALLLAAGIGAPAQLCADELQPLPLLPGRTAEGSLDGPTADGPTIDKPTIDGATIDLGVDSIVDPGELLVDTPPGQVDTQPVGVLNQAHLLEETAPAYSSGEWLFSGGWYFQEEVVVMQKARLDEQLIAIDTVNPALTLSTASDTATFEPGTRMTLGKIYARDVWNRDHMVEFRFFGMFDWPSQARIVRTSPASGGSINTLLGPKADDVRALYGNNSQRFIERSSLDNFELNVRMRTRGTRDRMVLQHDGSWIRHQTSTRIWSCYTGLTSFFLDEQFDMLGVGPSLTRGRFLVATDNDMFGVHFGGEYIEQAAIWNWGVRGRVGGLANFASRRSQYTSQIDDAAPTTRSEFVDRDNLTFLIEGGIFASLQISPNATLRAGYDLLYLAGVAQATGNINLPVGAFSPMEVNDDALYHGGSVGFTMVW